MSQTKNNPNEQRRYTKNRIFLFIILTAVYYFLNPYWYGDSLVYSTEISMDGGYVTVDSGHLILRPLARSLWLFLGLFSEDIDPLVSFRLLSSLATALLLIVFYALAQRLEFRKWEAFAATLLLACTHMVLAYGGSGCSYTAAMAMGILSALFLLHHDQRGWNLKEGAFATLFFIIGWMFWALELLLLPVIFVIAIIMSNGSYLKRFMRSAALCLSIVIIIFVVLFFVHKLIVFPSIHTSFSEWLNESRHTVGMTSSLVGIYRAVFGFLVGFLYLDFFGTSIKGMMIGDPSLVKQSVLVTYMFILIPFVVLLFWSGFRVLLSIIKKHNKTTLFLSAIVLVAFIPIALFAALWQGSDVERFSLALPFVCLLFIYGFSHHVLFQEKHANRLIKKLYMLPAFYLLLMNFSTLIVPTLVNRGGFYMSIGRVAREQVNEKSIVIFSGQYLGARLSSNLSYFFNMRGYNIMFRVFMDGAEGWDLRLAEAISEALDRDGQVVVLSDLLGEPTPGGLAWSFREYPVPGLDDIMDFFQGWEKESSWSVDRYTFYEIIPPADWAPGKTN